MIKQPNIYGFYNLFSKFFLNTGIKKEIDKLVNKIKYQNISNFYYNLNRLKNSPIKILKEDINGIYLDKFKS